MRYSVVGAQPTIEIVAKGNVFTVMDHGAGRRTVEEVDDPITAPQRSWRSGNLNGFMNCLKLSAVTDRKNFY